MALLLAILLLAGCGSPGRAEPAGGGRPDVAFADYAYVRPDIEAIYAWLDDLCVQMEAAESAEEAYRLYQSSCPAWEDYLAMHSVAMLRSSADVEDTFYAEEYALLNEAGVQISLRQAQLYEIMLAAPYADALADYLGREELEAMRQVTAQTTPEVAALLEAEAALEQRYTALAGSAAITVDGVDYGYEAIGSIPGLDAESYWNYIDTFFTRYNRELGEILLELIALRQEIAEALGYDSFVELGYLRMGRTDYDRQDVLRLRHSIESYVSPYINELYDEALASGTLNLLPDRCPVPDMDAGEIIDACRSVWAALSPDADACAALLEAYGLSDLTAREHKDVSTFTTYLTAYRAPYIFAHLTGYNFYDIGTLQHEFGHAFAYYRQAERMGSPDLAQTYDISEIFSGAMELLSLPHYEVFFGDEAETAVSYALIGVLETLLTSAVYDEFNERIYTELPETVEEINRIYAEVLDRYIGNDFTRAYDTSCGGRFWILIPHFFTAPFYSIDYALADLVALQLWKQQEENPEAAFQRYEALIDAAYGLSFPELVGEAGLQNPFDDKVIKDLVGEVIRAIDRQAGRQPEGLAA